MMFDVIRRFMFYVFVTVTGSIAYILITIKNMVVARKKIRVQGSECKFCMNSIARTKQTVLYSDDLVYVLEDINPDAKFHFLINTHEHIVSINSLKRKDIPLLQHMQKIGSKMLQEKGCDPRSCTLGFHVPPFYTIKHLHMHAMGGGFSSLLHKLPFIDGTWLFTSTNQLIATLNKS
ncbi:histidine triad nucleotide-binding protein [Acrasis kona]|uniref:Histidine triad nucleotide-binding protein n=1 Tax=Acrasis kona TaxID=1008807 RepID=A0AAW2Z5V0_9EUKA